MDWQNLGVLIVVVLAAAYLGWNLWRWGTSRALTGCIGCKGCGSSDDRKELHSIDPPSQRK